MQITVNGKKHDVTDVSTISEMLAFFEIDIDKIAVEKNKDIIACEKYAEESVSEGDVFELIRFMGGG